MPRKQFVQDFETARSANSVPHVHDLCRGEDDGQISFLYAHADLAAPVKITALVPDLGDYPRCHDFMVFTDDDAPAHISQAISRQLSSVHGITVLGLLELCSSILTTLCTSVGDDLDSDVEMQEEDSEEDLDEDYAIYDPAVDFFGSTLSLAASSKTITNQLSLAMLDRRKVDLQQARAAGFRVGKHGALVDGNSVIISISCRIKKLGLPDDVMKVWQIQPDNYLILLIRYPVGYRNLQQLEGLESSQVATFLDVRIGTGSKYKPTYLDAINAFQCESSGTAPHADGSDPVAEDEHFPSTFKRTFISRPLVDLLRIRLLSLIKFRHHGLSWSGAESFYNDLDGQVSKKLETIKDSHFEPEVNKIDYPELVMADHFTSCPAEELSFPLLAMQFMLRHFVRCTEFCLVCHRTLPKEIEALKPYVCERPLCLYQYMTLGFGPTIEHEILFQPLVVDLLVSFCYLSAADKSLKSFPLGLNLTIPRIHADLAVFRNRAGHILGQALPKGLKATLDARSKNIKFDAKPGTTCPFKAGQWITCVPEKFGVEPFHCRLLEVEYYPSVLFSRQVAAGKAESDQSEESATSLPISVYGYDVAFDDISDMEKHGAIQCLLDTLPNVDEMRLYILGSSHGNLRSWNDRISPSALGVLRWIIASNRACILHVPEDEASRDERVHGMRGWSQFKFVTGAPDKEYRFIKAVRETTHRLNLKHPTLFAWHGSPLRNWHSIIREGLRFDTIANGRAYGNGCYHSLNQATSMGYAGGVLASGWPSSSLKLTTVMSLNEIVNAPNEFTSKTPHLVVKQLDWIQTRHLFVKADNATTSPTDFIEPRPSNVLAQDPAYTPMGVSGPIVIPAKMAAGVARPTAKRKLKTKKGTIKAKIFKMSGLKGSLGSPIELSDGDDSENEDALSEPTDDEDHGMLIEQVDLTIESDASPNDSGVEAPLAKDLFLGCRFKPGMLDHAKLPIMPQPSYASLGTSKRLQKDFLILLKVQQSTPARELGWYIDPAKFENVYQWIVELHSFDQFEHRGGMLPLAKDMNKAGLESIVMEMRFGASYPMSPPFIRVIRPRFLGFQQGGGGHVTYGGAMCMELLTNDGWTAATSLEAVLLQVRLAMASTSPQPARLAFAAPGSNGLRGTEDYGAQEAVDAYKRACLMHGWKIPADFEKTAEARPPPLEQS
ncbi:hypothetical protein ANO11243_079750 [Dothideomycetidae sp. 11243]|nr:hypothetical protein ANO11243_079750 [fungal sp. No.11243]